MACLIEAPKQIIPLSHSSDSLFCVSFSAVDQIQGPNVIMMAHPMQNMAQPYGTYHLFEEGGVEKLCVSENGLRMCRQACTQPYTVV